MDVCLNCGSSEFDEENGLYFCSICQTQRQGRTQEVTQDFSAVDLESGEVTEKRKKKIISTGVLWTTTEAFNHILLSQVNALIDAGIVSYDFKEMVLAIWCSYLKYCEVVSSGKNGIPKLHSAARFRDIQIFRSHCNEVPLYKYAKSSNPKRRRIRFGNRVIQPKNFHTTSEEVSNCEDIAYSTTRIKRTVSDRLFSSQVRQEIRNIVYGDVCRWEEIIDTESSEDEDLMVSERCKKLKTVYNSGYLSSTKHIHASNDCFVGILTLPKTIAILNLALRLCNKNIFTGDLLLWIKQGYIPYFNTTLSLPKNWKILSNDCRTFVPTTSPTALNIDAATVKVANALKLQCLPEFKFLILVERYVEDLNLPMALMDIMKFQNVFKTPLFSDKLLKNIPEMRRLPPFEAIALMSIALLLKRLFGLDGKSEKLLSNIARTSSSNFIWEDWESYSRLRLHCLKHYYVPIHDQRDSIRSVDSVVNFYNEVAQHWRPKNILSQKKDDSTFRSNLRSVFKRLSSKFDLRKSHRSLPTSIFHLKSATDAVLNQVDSGVKEKLSVDFRMRDLSFIANNCVVYSPLQIGSAGCNPNINCVEKNWSLSFVLLLELSCVILQCKIKDLYTVLNQLERVFLIHHWKLMRN